LKLITRGHQEDQCINRGRKGRLGKAPVLSDRFRRCN